MAMVAPIRRVLRQMVRFGHLLRVSQDVQYLLLSLRREGHVRAVLRGRFAADRTRS